MTRRWPALRKRRSGAKRNRPFAGLYHLHTRSAAGAEGVSPQSDNVLFAQSRNVLLTPSRLGRWQKDNY